MGQARLHVPYRNSMVTTALRDSLGGNCRTVMVANVTGAAGQLNESISTCRFAQRVALVSNEVTLYFGQAQGARLRDTLGRMHT